MKKGLICFCVFLINVGVVLTSFAATGFNPKDTHHVLFVPAGQGVHPAVLLLHGSNGIDSAEKKWADLLDQQGYVTYMVDSFTPHGYKNRADMGAQAIPVQLEDAKAAYHYLASLPEVDVHQLYLLGFGMGGLNVMRLMEQNSGFTPKAGAALYGTCKSIPDSTRFVGPLKIFIGEKDDRADMPACKALVERAKARHELVGITIYKNAQHAFDNAQLPTTPTVMELEGEKFYVAFNPAAQQAAYRDVLLFLKEAN